MRCYIFDLDGTLALCGHRQHLVQGKSKDWDEFFRRCVDDEPNLPVVSLYHMLRAGAVWGRDASRRLVERRDFFIFSGRSDAVRPATEQWLADAGIEYDLLLMRRDGDFTPDEELKRMWMQPYRDQIEMVFDDRDKVVAMWREECIPCCQVARGDF